MARRRPGIFAVLLASAALGGCGFHLRGELPESSAARSLYIAGLGQRNAFYGDLVRVLSNYGGSVAPKPDKAGAVVNIVSAQHYRRPITLSSGGRANTFDLTFRVVYDIRTPAGEELVPEQELIIRRDYFNQQVTPLGQGAEEALMREEMEEEAAQNLFRRVVFSLNHKKPAAPA
jgi:LPS-assembly lipoprotein